MPAAGDPGEKKWQFKIMRLAFFISVLLTFSETYAQTISQSAITKLVVASKESHSASLALSYQDKILLDQTFAPIDSLATGHSILKSISALAVGCLIREKKIRSLNEPVYRFYPEWKQGLKKSITIKHLMNHTSGIECEDPNDDYFNAVDVLQHALCANIVDTPCLGVCPQV